MARRRNRDGDWIGLVAQLAGLLMLLSLISPQVRQTIFAVGYIMGALLLLAGLALIGFVIYRWLSQSQTSSDLEVFDLSSLGDATAPLVNVPSIEIPERTKSAAPQTTDELLEQLRSIDWFQFEKLVAVVYRKHGYVVTRRGGANADGGIDLLIEKDGKQSAVQCKHWKTWTVGVKAVREFVGALADARIHDGIFITLCGYSGDAKQLAERHGIEIVNEVGLAKLIEATDARFDPETLAILQDTRKFCPKCESGMLLRTATKGRGAGQKFWGCSKYPKCKFTMPA